MPTRKRGSLVDTVTLEEFVFQFEPRTRGKNKTEYAKQHIIGRRLANLAWIGGGESGVELDVFLLGVDTNVATVQAFKNFLAPQADTGAPHPVFINVGDTYVGKKFVMTECDDTILTFEYADSMNPVEVGLKMKFEELPAEDQFTVGGL